MRPKALFILLLVASLLTTAIPAFEGPPAVRAPASTPHLPDVRAPTLARSLLDAATDHLDDPTFLRLAVLAQFEQQGLLPPGAVRAAAAGGSPSKTFRDARLGCDLDADGVRDLLLNELADEESTARAVSGATGATLWRLPNAFLFLQMDFARRGEPEAGLEYNLQPAPDLDGDGACDALALGFDRERVGVPFTSYPRATLYEGHLRAISGRTGGVIWTRELASSEAYSRVPPLAIYAATVVALQGFPTGLTVFDSPQGPRYVLKTTDLYDLQAADPTGVTILPFGEVLEAKSRLVGETVVLGDLRTGAPIWTRGLEPSPGHANYTWLTGVVGLPDGAFEVLLDQYTITSPQSSTIHDPVTGDPLFHVGRGMNLLALDGRDGGDLWRTRVHDEAALRANLPAEDKLQVLEWTHAQLLPDLTGDGIADPVALYLTKEYAESTTINGKAQTHVVPLDGVTGARLWQGDRQHTGWGFVAPLTPGGSTGLLGFGTVDLSEEASFDGVFPPKSSHLGAFDRRDGTPVWSETFPFALDVYSLYHLHLGQFYRALAPHDWDGDGAHDLVTPPQGVEARGNIQLLLASQNHAYEVRSGRDGRVLHRVEVPGAPGMLVPCPGAPAGELTFLGGHVRRLELYRVAPESNAIRWRVPVWEYPGRLSMSAGFDLVDLHARCAQDEAGRTFYAGTLQADSPQRGAEVVPVFGALDPTGAATWQKPVPASDLWDLDALGTESRPAHGPALALLAALAVAAAAVGAVVGLGAARLHRPPGGPR